MPGETIRLTFHEVEARRNRMIRALDLMDAGQARECFWCLVAYGAIDITISEDGSRAWHNLVPVKPKEDKP